MDAGVVVSYEEALITPAAADELRVALAVPASGQLGLARPSVLATSILAAEEINATSGVRGRRLVLVPVDAGAPARLAAAEVSRLVDASAVGAVVGVHTSDVHRAIEQVTSHRVPYLFTAPHEGGTRLPGVALLGPDPIVQLHDPMARLAAGGARRWVLLGNDYIWPRTVHRAARAVCAEVGAQAVAERLVPLGFPDVQDLVDWVATYRPDAVLLSLVGRDLASFNRAFAGSRLHGRVKRLSGALEETGLLEIGGDDSGELYAAMTWFAGLSMPGDDGFEERYAGRWGAHRPVLGAYARGCYDGVRLLAGAAEHLSPHRPAAGLDPADLHPLARRPRLARADGTGLRALS